MPAQILRPPGTAASVPGEALFQDPALSREVVARAFNREIERIKAVLVRGVPGKRSLFELELAVAPGETCRVVAKLYCGDQGARAYEVLRDLRARGFSEGRCRVPEPLSYDPGWRLLLLEWAEGMLLRDAIRNNLATPAHMEDAALWLARLHRCGTATGRVYTFARHLHTLGVWADRIASVLPPARPLLDGLLRRIEEGGMALSGWTPGPTHRDFSPDHLLRAGHALIGLDFDEFCQYDRMFDVAHFLAHLGWSVARQSEFDKLADAFCAAYRALAPEYAEARIALHTAASYFKLAHITAMITRPADWEDRVVLLLNAAQRATRGFPCQ